MTDLRQAAQQALEALTYCEALNRDVEQQKTQAITALRKALEQSQQEPVAVHQFRSPHCSDWYDGYPDHHDLAGHGPYEIRTLYTTPPQRKPLTMDEIGPAWAVADGEHNASASVKRRITRAIEAAHGIKEGT
jgi:hypothetical protein